MNSLLILQSLVGYFFSLSFKIQSRRRSQISQPPSTLTTQKVWHQIMVAWYPEITATLVMVKNWGVSDWPQGAVKCFLKYWYLCVRDLLAIHAKQPCQIKLNWKKIYSGNSIYGFCLTIVLLEGKSFTSHVRAHKLFIKDLLRL